MRKIALPLAVHLVLAGSVSQAAPVRFLGPPQKKPAGPVAEAIGEAGDALKVGDEAPSFTGLLFNPAKPGTDTVDLSALVGDEPQDPQARLVLISFFATWCKPCRRELPVLVKLDRELRGKGLRVISVAIDREEDKWPMVRQILEQESVSYPVVKDRYGFIAKRYLGDKIRLPALFLIGADGKIRRVQQGYARDAESFLRGEVQEALSSAVVRP